MLLAVELIDVPFVVVDLETTGGSSAACEITEVGAVRITAGEVIGEFASLVDPAVTDPPVTGEPPVEAVLPTFLEFSRGAVLVAHNARFDLGFLNANLARLDYPPLSGPVVCTVTLARRLLRDEVHDCRLATLAAYFRCRTQPVHRALPDARATVEVFHALLERAGSFGVVTLDALVEFTRARRVRS
jgi:DNA polymerase III subunit epsilon